MSGKYAFDLKSEQRRLPLPRKIIVGQEETETDKHVLLKLLGFVLFYRDQIQIAPRLQDDNIPFRPGIIAFDYTLRPTLWVECDECSVTKLDRLAVKVPDAEIWVMKHSKDEAQELRRAMAKGKLRTNRYAIVALDREMFDEMSGLLRPRNSFTWYGGGFDPPSMQFEFNGLWFDTTFEVLRF